ncbi:MAG: response regulator [Candidatus Scalindua sp.]|nr:response regulator [Candidatus Scalindua sp.]
MNDIIEWLREVEYLANKVYLKAASIYAGHPELRKFLEDIAEDEAWHYYVMGSAKEYFASIPDLVPVISVDKETREKIIECFTGLQAGLEENILSIDELIMKIVEVELSECNDIFLYVVNLLKEKNNEFKDVAPKIQAHIKKIEYFLETIDGGSEALKKITELPPLWVENILIVDDEQIITNLLKALLNRSGNIDVAHNGQDALKLIEKKYYKLIVSDINMPIMDGISLYKEAVAKFPKLSTRFLFMTGGLSTKNQAFFMENQIKYLTKPVEINLLRKVASEIILSK